MNEQLNHIPTSGHENARAIYAIYYNPSLGKFPIEVRKKLLPVGNVLGGSVVADGGDVGQSRNGMAFRSRQEAHSFFQAIADYLAGDLDGQLTASRNGVMETGKSFPIY